MANTVSGALKTYIEGLGLNLTVDRNRANMSRQRPYVVVYEDIDLAMVARGDAGKTTPVGVELVQVDLWQNEASESATLADALSDAFEGAVLSFGTPAKTVYGVAQRGRTRSVEQAALGQGASVNLVHHAYTLDIHRQV